MQQVLLLNLGRVISMKQYAAEITDEALVDMEQLYKFYVIKEDRVIVTDVLYSASDIQSRLKG